MPAVSVIQPLGYSGPIIQSLPDSEMSMVGVLSSQFVLNVSAAVKLNERYPLDGVRYFYYPVRLDFTLYFYLCRYVVREG